MFLENHDQSRSISRFASDNPEHRVASGKMLALMNATLSGTLFIYQGQEIGMVNFPLDWSMDEYKDVDSNNYVSVCSMPLGYSANSSYSIRWLLSEAVMILLS